MGSRLNGVDTRNQMAIALCFWCLWKLDELASVTISCYERMIITSHACNFYPYESIISASLLLAMELLVFGCAVFGFASKPAANLLTFLSTFHLPKLSTQAHP